MSVILSNYPDLDNAILRMLAEKVRIVPEETEEHILANGLFDAVHTAKRKHMPGIESDIKLEVESRTDGKVVLRGVVEYIYDPEYLRKHKTAQLAITYGNEKL